MFRSWRLGNHLLSWCQSSSYDVGTPLNMVLDLLRRLLSQRMPASLTFRLVNKTNLVVILPWWLQRVVTEVWDLQVVIFLLIVHAFFEKSLVRLRVSEAAARSVGKSTSTSSLTLFTSTSSSQASRASAIRVGAL